jgi:hypothetical protein
MSEMPRQTLLDYQYILLKNERQEGKACLFGWWALVRGGEFKERWVRVNIVDVFCMHI